MVFGAICDGFGSYFCGFGDLFLMGLGMMLNGFLMGFGSFLDTFFGLSP